MDAIASPEFISLCRTQLRLLTQQMAGSSAAIYIAEAAGELRGDRTQSNFVPIASYPEPIDSWVANFARATAWASPENLLALPGTADPVEVAIQTDDTWLSEATAAAEPERADDHADRPEAEASHFDWPKVLKPERQLVMPLVYTDVVVGLLVSVHPDRAWESEERSYIETMAESLAAGCVLERRNQWLQGRLAQKRGLQSRQSEIFHNLLHQFRNPLTAVSTFGQLLVKRLEPEDVNKPIATGIVRENKRLRELVSHFDEAVAVGDADLAETLSLLPTAPALLSAGLGAEGDVERGLDATASLGHSLSLSAQHIPDIVAPILAVARIVTADRCVNLHAQVAADTPPVWGDEEALGEVVSNLVDNAIKYSSTGAQMWVQTGVSRIDASGHYQGIVVGDTGPGIPTGDLERLFERSFRGVQAEGSIPGTGLGLAIAQSLVNEMRGSIEVISPATGTPWMPRDVAGGGPGTVFIVWLLEVERARLVG
ncbi:MAG: GAF domain-containing sensor histidine kinase [Phormidesmis sp.]